MAQVWHIDTTERSAAVKKEGAAVTRNSVDGYQGHRADERMPDSEGPTLYASVLYHVLEMTKL